MQNTFEIVEVGPRDGLQSQPKLLDVPTKIEFITRLIDAGHTRLEVASFVNPKRVPQMADADELVRGLPRRAGVKYIGLVLNQRGFERALDSGIEQINSVDVASETFCQRNQGASTAQMSAAIAEMARAAQAARRFFGVTIAASFGCPFEGRVAPEVVLERVRRYVDLGVDEIALADSIGVAVPSQVTQLLAGVIPLLGSTPLRLHFHNTRNTGIANIYAAALAGVRIFDASCGGVGGCPFAPGATGNVGTEDVLYLLEGMGLTSGVALSGIIATARWLEGPLGGQLPAMVSRATPFPPLRATA
ncbi:MAG: hydroxymethylglutaryl-CoA lyase [Gammaproteobacteria bacterium]|nr:hydroxymethylglutaryl-CoA lyase [Gammaproteobacteria bacterium]